MKRAFPALIAAPVFILGLFAARHPDKGKADATREAVTPSAAVLWREPKDIASRNLFYGPGGKDHVPNGTFKFQEEDTAGTSPKFDVVDQDGVRWRVKMGPESHPETAATRLVWAVGYFANEDYFMPVLHVENMQRLRRGWNLVSPDNNVRDVRLKRHLKDEKKVGSWSWAKDPFTGTREWNGLRVLMAVMNNWDLKDINNAIYRTSGTPAEDRYVVSDLGASFGPTGLSWTIKGKPSAYYSSKMIKSVSSKYVDFNIPSRPAMTTFIDFPDLGRRIGLLWLGHHIPRQDAKWMGDLLGRLSPGQIRDAFRAAGYAPTDVEGLSSTLERRIRELQNL